MTRRADTICCDVLVIGCGPAGAAAARAALHTASEILPHKSLRVLMAERRAVVGVPVRCAEYIPAMLVGEAGVGKAAIVQSIVGMRSFLHNTCIQDLQSPGYIIHRHIFDQALATAAQKAGAELLLEHSVRDSEKCHDGTVLLHTPQGKTRRIQATVIIGADGPHSRVARWLHTTRPHCIPALQVRLPLKKTLEHTHTYFDEAFTAGYAWLFPKNTEANVGLGMLCRSQGETLRTTLRLFVERLHQQGFVDAADMAKARAHDICGGWIPAEAPRACVQDNVMLVGDAAGHTHPITGAGIFQAVRGGSLAGHWAAQALIHDDLSLLHNYAAEWDDFYGDTLRHAHGRRLLWEAHAGSLEKAIRSFWIGFREYYADE